LKIIALPDLHEAMDRLRAISDPLAQADIVLLVGDLTNSGHTPDVIEVVNAVRQYNSHVLAVPGNWDRREVDEYLTQEGINLHRCNIIIDGIAFFGVGGSLLQYRDSPNEITESQFETFLNEAVEGLDPAFPKILVSHQPPINTLSDLVWTDMHTGSEAVRAFIERVQPVLCFTGHIHEAKGIDSIGLTKIINPGPLWQDNYAYVEIENDTIVALEIRTTKNIPKAK
jgi:Icc-related predicted phosphoesterase